METTENEKFDANIHIEAKLLEQEHRPTHLVLNYFNRKKNYPDEDDPRRKAVQRAIIWRLFFSPAMLAVGGSATIGIISLLILNKQNSIIEQQTSILQEQNKKMEIQANLEDANRRNNLVFLMDNVLNRVYDELKDSMNIDSSLSKPLLARIQALGQGFKPYKFIDYSLKDSLKKDSLGLTKLYSPERGQLLLSLVNSGIGKKTISHIYENISFDRAFLESANLSGADLSEVILTSANLKFADLSDVNLKKAYLDYSEFTKTNLTKADLAGAYLEDAQLKNAFMNEAKLTDTQLSFSNMREINLEKANLMRAYISDAILTSANLSEANFTDANLGGSNLSFANLRDANLNKSILSDTNLKFAILFRADLRKAILTDAYIRGANLRRVDLTGADLTGADLRRVDLSHSILVSTKLKGVNLNNIKSIDSCKVDRKDWLIYIRDSLKLKGADVLAEEYKVVEYINKDFIILKK